MRRTFAMYAAAALAAGAFAYTPAVRADCGHCEKGHAQGHTDAQHAGDKAKINLPAGVTSVDDIDRQGIHQTLAKVSDAFYADQSLDDLTTFFSKEDQNRLKNFGDNHQLQATLKQFQQAWQQKYNEQFSFQPNLVFGDRAGIQIVQGEVSNPQLLSNWPVDASGEVDVKEHKDRKHMDRDQEIQQKDMGDDEREGLQAEVGGPGMPEVNLQPGLDDQQNAANRDIGGEFEVGADHDRHHGQNAAHDLKKGESVALVMFPADGEAEGITISLVKSGNDWKLDIPNSVTTQKLESDLNKGLTMALQTKDEWPADKAAAYRMAAHHLMLALYGVDSGKSEAEISVPEDQGRDQPFNRGDLLDGRNQPDIER